MSAMRIKFANGFTLIEVAVVLVIVGFLLASVLMPLRSQQESAKITKAQEELKSIEESLYGFAITNQRLPCPTQPGMGGRGDFSGTACNTYHGFVPSTDLALKGSVNCDGLLLDPWGNPYRYSITNSDQDGDANVDFVVFREMQDVTIGILNPDIQVCRNHLAACNTTTPAANIVTNNAVAVFFSMGKNWPNSSTLENENAGEAAPIASTCGLASYNIGNDRFFYSMQRIESGTTFDDIVFWLSPNILYSRMLAAGQLP